MKNVQFTRINKKIISTLTKGKVDMMKMTMQRTRMTDVMKTTDPRWLKDLELPPLIVRHLIQEANR